MRARESEQGFDSPLRIEGASKVLVIQHEKKRRKKNHKISKILLNRNPFFDWLIRNEKPFNRFGQDGLLRDWEDERMCELIMKWDVYFFCDFRLVDHVGGFWLSCVRSSKKQWSTDWLIGWFIYDQPAEYGSPPTQGRLPRWHCENYSR